MVVAVVAVVAVATVGAVVAVVQCIQYLSLSHWVSSLDLTPQSPDRDWPLSPGAGPA